MRENKKPYLIFEIDNQTVNRVDKFRPVRSSVAYLKALFLFDSDDWEDVDKLAIFGGDDNDYNVIIPSNGEVTVPYEVLDQDRMTVSVVGTKGTKRITTGQVVVHLSPTGYVEGETPEEPTATVYAQLMTYFDGVKTETAQSASSASQSATAAQASASTATTKATEAAAQATAASTSASTASTKAAEATTKATQAATSATDANTAKTGAETAQASAQASAQTASTKASEASASASTASTKASEASASATSASTSASQAAASLAEMIAQGFVTSVSYAGSTLTVTYKDGSTSEYSIGGGGGSSYDDTELRGRISTIEGKESGWDSKAAGNHNHDSVYRKSSDVPKIYVIMEDMVDVTTDATKGVAPYSTSYGYTNITIDGISEDDLTTGTILVPIINTKMVVASSYRNVRIRFGESGSWKPVFSTTGILGAYSWFVKGQMIFLTYSTEVYASGAFHKNYDKDTTYSAITKSEVTTGTATTSRCVTGKVMAEILADYAKSTDVPAAVTDEHINSLIDAKIGTLETLADEISEVI